MSRTESVPVPHQKVWEEAALNFPGETFTLISALSSPGSQAVWSVCPCLRVCVRESTLSLLLRFSDLEGLWPFCSELCKSKAEKKKTEHVKILLVAFSLRLLRESQCHLIGYVFVPSAELTK